MYNPKVGDIVKVTKKDGRFYECFVVGNAGEEVFYGKVLDSSSKVPTTSWKRYGLVDDCSVQMIKECKNIELVSEAEVSRLEDLSETTIYRNGKYAFCLSEDYGGWSEDHENYIFESVSRARLNKESAE